MKILINKVMCSNNFTNSIICSKKCCELKYLPYFKDKLDIQFRSKIKAGAMIYDTHTNKILLVQSRFRLWGPPKGSLLDGETPELCAIREVKEETGIIIPICESTPFITIKNRVRFYILEVDGIINSIPEKFIGNDVTGIGWINVECLQEMVRDKNIFISKNCQIIIKKIFNIFI